MGLRAVPRVKPHGPRVRDEPHNPGALVASPQSAEAPSELSGFFACQSVIPSLPFWYPWAPCDTTVFISSDT